MTCQQVQNELSLYLYGELEFAAEEQLEAHLFACAFCQHALAREKEWHACLRADESGPTVEVLTECREQLHHNLAKFLDDGRPRRSFWANIRSWFDVPVLDWASRGALAVFLVMLGFGMGRFTGPAESNADPDIPFAASMISPATRIREVRAEQPGQVRILVEEIRQGEIQGRLDDEHIRQFILAATQRSADPAVRVDSVQAISGQNGLDVRDVLLSSARRDPNAAVRLKALEGLRLFSAQPATRQTLRFVLENDDNPAVRAEAINILVPMTSPVHVNPELLNTLESVAHSDQMDEYVRMRALDILQQSGALSDTY